MQTAPALAKITLKRLPLVLVAGLMLGSGLPAASQSPTAPANGRQVNLREQLTVGLKAVTKADLAFIDKVVLLVEQRQLPRPLVDSTFLWARQRAQRHSRSRRLRPMVYFRPGLTQRAKQLGVIL